MNKYEALYVIDAAMEDQARADLIALFQKLAYPINFKNEGYYVLMQFSAKPEFPRELERNFQINENIMRYLVTRIEE